MSSPDPASLARGQPSTTFLRSSTDCRRVDSPALFHAGTIRGSERAWYVAKRVRSVTHWQGMPRVVERRGCLWPHTWRSHRAVASASVTRDRSLVEFSLRLSFPAPRRGRKRHLRARSEPRIHRSGFSELRAVATSPPLRGEGRTKRSSVQRARESNFQAPRPSEDRLERVRPPSRRALLPKQQRPSGRRSGLVPISALLPTEARRRHPSTRLPRQDRSPCDTSTFSQLKVQEAGASQTTCWENLRSVITQAEARAIRHRRIAHPLGRASEDARLGELAGSSSR